MQRPAGRSGVRAGYVGRMDVPPEHGPAGTPVTVTAEGLPPGEEFQIVWVTYNGDRRVANAEYRGREFTEAAYGARRGDAVPQLAQEPQPA
jgi:hypothetical protein